MKKSISFPLKGEKNAYMNKEEKKKQMDITVKIRTGKTFFVLKMMWIS